MTKQELNRAAAAKLKDASIVNLDDLRETGTAEHEVLDRAKKVFLAAVV